MLWNNQAADEMEDEAEAVSALRHFAKAYQEQNIEAVLGCFDANAQIRTADGEVCLGRTQLASRLLKEFGQKQAIEVVAKALSLERVAGAIRVTSQYDMVEADRNRGSRSHVSGEFRATLRREGDHWKIHHAEFRFSVPAHREAIPPFLDTVGAPARAGGGTTCHSGLCDA